MRRLGQVKRQMAKRFLLFLLFLFAVVIGSFHGATAQETETKIRVEVDMVQLNVAVMDRKGNYVTGLRPSDFEVSRMASRKRSPPSPRAMSRRDR